MAINGKIVTDYTLAEAEAALQKAWNQGVRANLLPVSLPCLLASNPGLCNQALEPGFLIPGGGIQDPGNTGDAHIPHPAESLSLTMWDSEN